MSTTVRQRVKETLDPAILGDPSVLSVAVYGEQAAADIDADRAAALLLRNAQALNRVVYFLAEEIDALKARQSG